jgi:hypothetical protein
VKAVVGWAAIVFSILYVVADVIEVAQGDFSTFRLLLTYGAEAAIPLFVIGLYVVQRPAIGPLGLVGAVAFAYSYVFFTSTVVYARTLESPWVVILEPMSVCEEESRRFGQAEEELEHLNLRVGEDRVRHRE